MKRRSEALSQNPIVGPGPGIAELRAVLALRPDWANQLISARKLGETAENFGLGNFSEDDILGLWQIGILRADFIEHHRQQADSGLVLLKNDAHAQWS